MKKELTSERIREVVEYDPDTGHFTWKISSSNRVKVGDIAGGINTATGYIAISIDAKRYRIHRLIWLYVYGEWPRYQIDHINGIRSDNKLVNLREVTNTDNARNSSMSKNNTSGFTGVSWHGHCNKWVAMIWINYKAKYLGVFVNKSDAIAARQAANVKYGYHANHGKKPRGGMYGV